MALIDSVLAKRKTKGKANFIIVPSISVLKVSVAIAYLKSYPFATEYKLNKRSKRSKLKCSACIHLYCVLIATLNKASKDIPCS